MKHEEVGKVEEETIGEAIYDFDGENDKELSFKVWFFLFFFIIL